MYVTAVARDIIIISMHFSHAQGLDYHSNERNVDENFALITKETQK